ncbi:unnamed protein product, partial [Callosobruchus maculatus]
FVTV